MANWREITVSLTAPTADVDVYVYDRDEITVAVPLGDSCVTITAEQSRDLRRALEEAERAALGD